MSSSVGRAKIAIVFMVAMGAAVTTWVLMASDRGPLGVPLVVHRDQPDAIGAALSGDDGRGDNEAVRQAYRDNVVVMAVDARTGQLLSGVEVAVASGGDRNPMQRRVILGRTSASGGLDVGAGDFAYQVAALDKPRLLCLADGYAIGNVAVDSACRSYSVAMVRCDSVTVACVDIDQRPVQGARVFVSKVPFRRSSRLASLEPSPLLRDHPASMAVAQTGRDGRAYLQDVSPGDYCVWVAHPDYAPIDDAWMGSSRLQVDGREDATCCMAPLVAVWGALPRRGVANLRIVRSSAEVVAPSGLDMAMLDCQRELVKQSSRFHGDEAISVARVGILMRMPEGPLDAVVAWKGFDGSREEAVLRYMPIDVVRRSGPQFLLSTVRDVAGARLVVNLVDRMGCPVAGIPLRLTPRQSGGVQPGLPHGARAVRSGESVMVENGSWQVDLAAYVFARIDGEIAFDIDGESEKVVTVQISEKVCRVEFRAERPDSFYPSLALDLYAAIDGARIGQQAVTGDAAAPMWLSPGAYRVHYAFGLEGFRDHAFSVADDQVSCRILLRGGL
jgi:hypothetical protein